MISRRLVLISLTVLLSFHANAEVDLDPDTLVLSQYDELPSFSADYYLRTNVDVANAYGRTNFQKARWHWINNGRYEGRPSSPAFHVRDYLELHTDIRNTFGQNYNDALWHFNNYGINEGRQSTHAFSVRDYIRLAGRGLSETNLLNAYIDWVSNGVSFGKQGYDKFWTTRYLDANPDLRRNLGENPFTEPSLDAYIHWLLYGRAEGRNDGLSKGTSTCSSGPKFAGGNRMFTALSDRYSEFVINSTQEVTEVRDVWNSRGLSLDQFRVYRNPLNRNQLIVSIDFRSNFTRSPLQGSWFFTMANTCGASSLSGNFTQQPAEGVVLPPTNPSPPGLFPSPSPSPTPPPCRIAKYLTGNTTVSKGSSTTFTLSQTANSVEVYNNGSGISARVNGTQITVTAPASSTPTWYTVYAINECGREAISGSIAK